MKQIFGVQYLHLSSVFTHLTNWVYFRWGVVLFIFAGFEA